MKFTGIITKCVLALIGGAWFTLAWSQEPLNISGIYPSLNMYNQEGECGTGAVVPWQGDLWVITYAPHMPNGSSDKLYQVSPDLKQSIFPGSVGGTPANRMIHRESNQLLIGPYLIDANKKIRVIPPTKMMGRLTGNARHLTDPKNKVYYATMEEGLYEVDVNTLEVICRIRDGHTKKGNGVTSKLPGYHGKGLYSGQGRLIYTNNGEHGRAARQDPTTTSGALAEWFGEGDWQLVRRNQFTEASGPGGIYGNANPDTDPVWAMGWDAKSLLLGLLENKQWHFYRLPKGSHSYDGAHGWNTEWPRIREIGEDDLLATMHGTFWRFPSTFSKTESAGIRPRSNYLKVIGDFCRWNDRIVLGCDDSAKSEFLNTRNFKAKHGAARQSNSNLWFIEPEQLDDFGPVIGRGAVWLREENVPKGEASDPYLFAGYDYRQLYLYHESSEPVTFQISIDKDGSDQWSKLKELVVPPNQGVYHLFEASVEGEWVRVVSLDDARNLTAHFSYRSKDDRTESNDAMFAGLDGSKGAGAKGMMRSLSFSKLGLVTESMNYYELSQEMELTKVDDSAQALKLIKAVQQPARGYQEDSASIIFEEDGKRYRLPGSRPPIEIDEVEAGKSLADYLSQSLTKAATVSTSSQHSDYEPKFAVDGVIGDDERRWISRQDDSENWIEIELNEPKSIREIWVVSGWKGDAAYVAKNFEVSYTNSEGEQVTLFETIDNIDEDCRIQLPEPVMLDKFRVTNRAGGYFRIYEIAAFSAELDVQKPVFTFADRVCREVATERDLLNVGGSFYELPARNAQGMAKIRPVATHNLEINDFCSHGGLLFFTGLGDEAEGNHIFRSEDGKAAVWAGVVDDLWKLGKPRGVGGPWNQTSIKADEISDPFLMTAYDQKTVTISATKAATISLQVDIDGTGLWVPYRDFEVKAGEEIEHTFPEGFSAYWVRAVSTADTVATVMFEYR